MLQSKWTTIKAEMDRLVAENSAIHPDTIENAKLFVRYASHRYKAADEIGMGYWPTIRVIWSLPPHPIEIEICQDHYEFYRFLDGATEIEHVACMARDEIPDRLQSLLDPIISVAE